MQLSPLVTSLISFLFQDHPQSISLYVPSMALQFESDIFTNNDQGVFAILVYHIMYPL